MTKGRVVLPFRFDSADEEQQVPPLRFAPVGMTPQFGGWGFGRFPEATVTQPANMAQYPGVRRTLA
jgi:hypothetical protein